MSNKLHYEFIVCQPVPDEHLIDHDWVRAATECLVLVSPPGEPLPLANEKLDPSLHLLVVQKVKLAVCLLGGEDEAMVSIRPAEELAIWSVD